MNFWAGKWITNNSYPGPSKGADSVLSAGHKTGLVPFSVMLQIKLSYMYGVLLC